MFGWDFLLTTLIVVVALGTGVIYTPAAGPGQGAARYSPPSAVRSASCRISWRYSPPRGAAACPAVASMVKYAGVAHPLWMAWRMLGETGGLPVE